LVQVSVDGKTWQTVFAAMADWTTIDIDLSQFAGRVIQVRCRLN
jgi:hypothetical protein